MASEARDNQLTAPKVYPPQFEKRQPTKPSLFLAEKLKRNNSLFATRHYISRSHESLDSRDELTLPSTADTSTDQPPLAHRLNKQMTLQLPRPNDRLLSLRSISATYPPMEGQHASAEDRRLHLGSSPYISRSQENVNQTEEKDHLPLQRPSVVRTLPLARLQPRRDSLKLPPKHDRLFHSRQQPQDPQMESSMHARPLPEVALETFKLRVPSTKWRTDAASSNGTASLTQWKSEPRLSGEKDSKQTDKDTSVLDKWELLQVAARITSAHCNLHVLLGISESSWQDIRYEHSTTTNQMLQLLLAWQRKDGVANRKKLITALHSARLEKLAAQVQDRSYYSQDSSGTTDEAVDPPLLPTPGRTKATRTMSSKPVPSRVEDVPKEFVCQSERRRGSAPVLQRQMTQNKLKELLQSMGENAGIKDDDDHFDAAEARNNDSSSTQGNGFPVERR